VKTGKGYYLPIKHQNGDLGHNGLGKRGLNYIVLVLND
jgi:hypothetical protein